MCPQTTDHLFDHSFISFENNGGLLVFPVAHVDYDLRQARYETAKVIEREVEPMTALQPVPA